MDLDKIANLWQVRCLKCGHTVPAPQTGIFRIGAVSYKKWTLRRCPTCNKIRFFAVESDPTTTTPQAERRKLLILLVCMVIFFSTFFSLLRFAFTFHPAYKEAVLIITADQNVKNQLGHPIEFDKWGGSIVNGHADISIPFSSPKGTGKFLVVADKRYNGWKFQSIKMFYDDKWVDLPLTIKSSLDTL